MSEQAEFLRALWPEGFPEGARMLIWTLPDKQSRWFADLGSAILAAESIPRDRDCYLGCGLTDAAKGPNERAIAGEIIALPGFWADVDIADEGHAGRKRRPETLEVARRLLRSFTGFPPSITVASGHGLQAWWLFKEPLIFKTAAERVTAGAQLRAFGDACLARAKAAGYDLDSVYDLARIMRIPGTMNCKVQSKHVPVKLVLDGE